MRLSNENLPIIKQANPSVQFPHYDRNALKAGIIHIGPGNFPLAHIAEKTHDLIQGNAPGALNYGIVGVSLQTSDRRDQLTPQDGLYTVVEQEPSGNNKIRVIGSVMNVLFAPENPQAVVDQIAAPETRIVSMTITPQTHQSYMNGAGGLNLVHPDIINDLDVANAPKTVFGYIARALQQREQNNLAGFTVMNLDNMEHNGDILGTMVRQFVVAFDASLASVVDAKLTFPNSMVDRIVPKTTPQFVADVTARTGFIDMAAIPAEPMPRIGSWVIEDKFANGRPEWEKLELVQIVPDVLPYEKMKLRLLNVSHAGIANLGDLAGHTYIDEVMADPLFKSYMATLMNNETEPTLLPVWGIDLKAYKAELVERFANPAVKDTTARVAKDAPLKVVLDSAQDQLDSGGSIELLALATAAWIRRFRVTENEKGEPVVAVHPMAEVLKEKAAEGVNDPAAMFGITEVFGDIGKNLEFTEAVQAYMDLLDQPRGVHEAIQAAVKISNDTCNMRVAALIRSPGFPHNL